MKRGVINPLLGCTDGVFRTKLRSVLRKIWRDTSRKEFIKRVRQPNIKGGRHKYIVICETCKREMKLNEMEKRTKKDGSLMKKEMSAYEVDHVENNPKLTIQNLGDYINHLFFSEMRILCWRCHKNKTYKEK